MKKRILSVLTAILMILAFVPALAYGTDESMPVKQGNEKVTEEIKGKIKNFLQTNDKKHDNL